MVYRISYIVYRISFSKTRWWYAKDHSSDCSDEEARRHGHPIFRTRARATDAGWHTWQTNYAARGQYCDWRDTGLCCETSILAG